MGRKKEKTTLRQYEEETRLRKEPNLIDFPSPSISVLYGQKVQLGNQEIHSRFNIKSILSILYTAWDLTAKLLVQIHLHGNISDCAYVL